MKHIKAIMASVLGLLLVTYLVAGFYILYGITHLERKPLVATPADFGLNFEEISFTPRDDSFKLQGWLIKSSADVKETIIFVHGIGTNRVSNSNTLKIASDLTNQGFNILMFDLRASGVSEGSFFTASLWERKDVLGAFDFLVEQRHFSSDSIGILGFSMGGAASSLAAAEEPRIKALVLESSFADARELVAQETSHATGLPESITQIFVPFVDTLGELLYDIDLDQMVPEEALKKIDYPTLVIHGKEDTRLHYSNSERLHQSSRHPKSALWITEGVKHTNSYEFYPEEYIGKLSQYFKEQLLSK